MYDNFKPTWLLEAIYQLTPEQLAANQIRAVLTDLDNTLIAWDNPDGTPELHQWINQLQAANIPVIVVSNNKSRRVARAVQPLGLDFIARALKPSGKGIREAARRLNIPLDQVVMVGDQLMTDIWGANHAGVKSVLVKPIVATDAWNTKINRALERKVIRKLIKQGNKMDWRTTL